MAFVALSDASLSRHLLTGKLSIEGLPRWARETFGIRALELHTRFFASLGASFAERLRASADEQGVRIVSVSVDAPRFDALPVVTALGCDLLTVREKNGFAEFAQEAAKYGIRALLEVDSGTSDEDATELRDAGFLVDFGNRPPPMRPERLERLASHVRAVRVTMRDFDEYGDEKWLDVARYVRILRQTGYDDAYRILYQGGEDEEIGILKAKALLERYL